MPPRPTIKTFATYQAIEAALTAGKPLRQAIREAAQAEGISYETAKSRYFRHRRTPRTKE